MVETINHKPLYSRQKDLRMCNHKFCAISPDGKCLAILQADSKRFEIVLSRLDHGSTSLDIDLPLSQLLRGFYGPRYNEHLECKWSPDGEHITVCSSINFMFILTKKLNFVVNVTEEILPAEAYPSWSGTFDYDPRYTQDIIAVGCKNRIVYFINVSSKEVMHQTDILGKDSIDSVVYHPRGTSLAVGCRDFNIFILDSESADIVFQIDMKFTVPELVSNDPQSPSTMNMSYNTVGEQLAVSTCDGKVRVWQLPVKIQLFDLCRRAILSAVPGNKLNELPLPKQILQRLWFRPFPTMVGPPGTGGIDLQDINCSEVSDREGV